VKIVVVGGCFPFQDFIEPARLYHQTLKNKLSHTGYSVDVVPPRYERIKNTLSKIEAENGNGKIDSLIFHLRTEPFMHLSKIWYRYENLNGKKAFSIHLAGFSKLYPELYDIPVPDRRILRTFEYLKESIIYHLLREFNYFLGSLFGNQRLAFALYKDFVLDLKAFCKEQSIQLIITGPISRPFSRFENALSQKISTRFEQFLDENEIEFIPFLGEKTRKSESMFFPNGIHVSEAGHDEIAEKLSFSLSLKV